MEEYEWKYENKVVREIEYDGFWCEKTGQYIDLGWDEYASTIHTWIHTLNIVNGKLANKGIYCDTITMSQYTFDLIQLETNAYYDNTKFGHFNLIVLENYKDNVIEVSKSGDVKGRVLIKNNHHKEKK